MADAKVVDEVNGSELSKKELKKIQKEQKKAQKKANKKRGGFIRLILTFLILIGFVYAFLYFNILDVRSKYVDSMIVGTPVSKIFVNAPGSTPADQSSDGSGTVSKGDLVMQVNDLTIQVADLEKQLADAQELNDSYVEQIAQLEPLAAEQVQFKKDKEAFDRMIAEGNPEAYKAFYEQIYPDTAKEEYATIVTQEVNSKEVKDYVATFTSMDEDKAAGILEVMTQTDLNLVVNILNQMSSDKSGAILSEMSPESAATVAKRMAPIGY